MIALQMQQFHYDLKNILLWRLREGCIRAAVRRRRGGGGTPPWSPLLPFQCLRLAAKICFGAFGAKRIELSFSGAAKEEGVPANPPPPPFRPLLPPFYCIPGLRHLILPVLFGTSWAVGHGLQRGGGGEALCCHNGNVAIASTLRLNASLHHLSGVGACDWGATTTAPTPAVQSCWP